MLNSIGFQLAKVWLKVAAFDNDGKNWHLRGNFCNVKDSPTMNTRHVASNNMATPKMSIKNEQKAFYYRGGGG